jgi:hypothetical protein
MNTIQVVEFTYYIYLFLIVTSPIVFGVTAYLHIKKIGSENTRKRLLIFSVLLLLLDAYQMIGSVYQRKQWEKMEKKEAVLE